MSVVPATGGGSVRAESAPASGDDPRPATSPDAASVSVRPTEHATSRPTAPDDDGIPRIVHQTSDDVTVPAQVRAPTANVYLLEHSNSGKKVSIRFDSIRQSDKFAASTLIFK